MTNTPEHAQIETKFVLNDSVYNLLRNFVNFVLPGAGALYFALAGIFVWGYANQVVAAIAALVVFLNILLAWVKGNYNQNEAAKNPVDVIGTLYVNSTDPEKATTALRYASDIDAAYLANKETVTFQVKDEAPSQ